jgi:putative hydrolase of the HAD superfamily
MKSEIEHPKSDIKKYRHIFFDLDHTIWDFDKNAEETLQELFVIHRLSETGLE